MRVSKLVELDEKVFEEVARISRLYDSGYFNSDGLKNPMFKSPQERVDKCDFKIIKVPKQDNR